jgi:serine/threonine protein kinase
MKTYEGENAQTYYDTEVENFTHLNGIEAAFPPGLLGLHTNFQHGKTYNVLFELANGGSLHDMLLHTDPPATGRQIFEFWKALLEVLKALERIHEIELDPQDGRQKVFQGYVLPIGKASNFTYLTSP